MLSLWAAIIADFWPTTKNEFGNTGWNGLAKRQFLSVFFPITNSLTFNQNCTLHWQKISPSWSHPWPPHLNGSPYVSLWQCFSDPRTTVIAGGTKAFWHALVRSSVQPPSTALYHPSHLPFRGGGAPFSLLWLCIQACNMKICWVYSLLKKNIWIINQYSARLLLITRSQALLFPYLWVFIGKPLQIACFVVLSPDVLERLITAAVSLTQRGHWEKH